MTALDFEEFWAEYEPIVHQISSGDRYQQRFFARFEQEDPSDPLSCWLWTARTSNGYAQFHAPTGGGLAHRYAYELMRGEIPAGLHIDHLCRVRRCVNPWHLEPVSQHENNVRADLWQRRSQAFAARTHCKNEHEFTPENTVMINGSRRCRECKSRQYRQWWARKKESSK